MQGRPGSQKYLKRGLFVLLRITCEKSGRQSIKYQMGAIVDDFQGQATQATHFKW